MKIHIALSVLVLSFLGCSQQSSTETVSRKNDRFEGKLVYQITVDGAEVKPGDSSRFMIIYAKDSLVRTESFTQLGKQVFIKHIPKNKAYLLIDMGQDKYAIQQNLNEIVGRESNYEVKKKMGSKKIAGRKAKKAIVKDKSVEDPDEVFYYKDISHDYLDAVPEIEGLPVEYTVNVDGSKIKYELISFEEKTISRDLFGVPSDFQRMTLEEFMEKLVPPSDN